MAPSAPPASLRCRPGRRATDRHRSALVLDYRGDAPPVALLDQLRSAGWLVPTVLPPPSGSIDWTRPDPVSGRDWSIRPYTVRGAVAVPGPAVSHDSCSVAWLRDFFERLEITLEMEPEGVLSLERPSQGLGVVIEGEERSLDGRRDRLVVTPLPGAPIHVDRQLAGDDLQMPDETPAPRRVPSLRPSRHALSVVVNEDDSPQVRPGPQVQPAGPSPAGPLVWDQGLAAG